MLAPVFGRLADRFGRKLMLIRSLAGFTVIIAIMGLVTSVEQLLVTRILQGLFAGFSPMAMAVASVSAPREKVSLAIARVQGAQLISVAVGPAIGGLVASHLGTRVAFFITAAMCALALVALIVLFQENRPGPSGEPRVPDRPVPLREFLRYRHFVPVMVLLVIAQFIDRGLSLTIPLHVAHLPGIDASAAMSGIIISVAAAGAALSSSVVARLSPRWSSRSARPISCGGASRGGTDAATRSPAGAQSRQPPEPARPGQRHVAFHTAGHAAGGLPPGDRHHGRRASARRSPLRPG